jgi:hypothetical protein
MRRTGLTSNGKRESATSGESVALSGLRAQRGAVEGPHFHMVAETALLILRNTGAAARVPRSRMAAYLYVIILRFL